MFIDPTPCLHSQKYILDAIQLLTDFENSFTVLYSYPDYQLCSLFVEIVIPQLSSSEHSHERHLIILCIYWLVMWKKTTDLITF